MENSETKKSYHKDVSTTGVLDGYASKCLINAANSFSPKTDCFLHCLSGHMPDQLFILKDLLNLACCKQNMGIGSKSHVSHSLIQRYQVELSRSAIIYPRHQGHLRRGLGRGNPSKEKKA